MIRMSNLKALCLKTRRTVWGDMRWCDLNYKHLGPCNELTVDQIKAVIKKRGSERRK